MSFTPDRPQPAALEGLRARVAAWDRAASSRIAVVWPHPRWLTLPLAALSLTANYGILWFAIALVPWLSGAADGWQRALYIGGAVLLTEVLTFCVKLVVGRRRPAQLGPRAANLIPLPRSHSFPSSHASMGMVGLLTTASLYPVWTLPLCALVAVLALSRVYLRVHYLVDVLAGLLFGAFVGALIVALVLPAV